MGSYQFDTGDLILVDGNSILDTLIEKLGHSKFSHCGIILKDPVYIDQSLEGLYFFESNTWEQPDAATGKVKFGIQLHKLENILNEYFQQKYKVYIRKLNGINITQDIKEKIKQIYEITKSIPYDLNPIHWLHAKESVDSINIEEYKKNNPLSKDELQSLKGMWCSAFNAYFYVKLGILSENTPWTLIAPKDFETDDCLTYINPYSLGTITNVL
jgi:hypothetical protein